MANTLEPKVSTLRVSDQNNNKAAVGCVRLLGLVTHNPDSLESILKGDDVDTNGQILTATAAGVAGDQGTAAVTMDDASSQTGEGVDAEFTIAYDDTVGAIATATAAGTAASNRSGSVIHIPDSAGTISGAGSGAVFAITITGTTYSVAVATPGTGYVVNDTVTIVGSKILGADVTNDIVITIATLEGGVSVASVDAPGSGFKVGDTITFPGTLFGGTSPTNDVVVTVATEQSQGESLMNAKVLLLQKLVNVRTALDAVDPDWETEWDANGHDLTISPYDVVSDEITDLRTLIEASDFNPDTVFAFEGEEEDPTQRPFADTN